MNSICAFSRLLSFIVAVQCAVVPNLPSRGGRVQYSYILNDGGYKYGFDTNEKYFAKQEAQRDNEVQGSYAFEAANGDPVNMEYTSGVRGFVPKGHFAENFGKKTLNLEKKFS